MHWAMPNDLHDLYAFGRTKKFIRKDQESGEQAMEGFGSSFLRLYKGMLRQRAAGSSLPAKRTVTGIDGDPRSMQRL